MGGVFHLMVSIYGADEGRSEKCKNNSNLTCEKYKRAPLYKSHSAYGFEEPFKYFTPSSSLKF